MAELFDRFAKLTGLSTLLGPGLVRRALKDLGKTPETAHPGDYSKVLPRVAMRMRAYLEQGEIEPRLNAMRALLVHEGQANVD